MNECLQSKHTSAITTDYHEKNIRCGEEWKNMPDTSSECSGEIKKEEEQYLC